MTGLSTNFVVGAAVAAGLAIHSGFAVADEAEAPRLQISEIEIFDEGAARKLMYRVAAPSQGGPYPLVVFSHGAMCGPDTYARITDFWAESGYVIVSPRHIDATSDRASIAAIDPAQLLDYRLADVGFAVEYLDKIESAAGFPGLIQRDRAAIAGHSFGGMIAQIISGLRLKDPQSGESQDRSDPRFTAAVIMSGVGPMPQMAEDGFSFLERPLIATGGTRDVGNVGSGPIFPWEWRMSPYALAPEGNKFALVMDEGGHYLGGLICRSDIDGAPDTEALSEIQRTTTLFLDAYIKNRSSARTALQQMVGARGRREFALK